MSPAGAMHRRSAFRGPVFAVVTGFAWPLVAGACAASAPASPEAADTGTSPSSRPQDGSAVTDQGDADEDDTSADDSSPDEGFGDDGADAGPPDLGPPVPCESDGGDGGPDYHDMSNPSCWRTWMTAALLPGPEEFSGGGFDGRYVYVANQVVGSGVVARLDTSPDGGGAISTASLSIEDGAEVGGFLATAFDGRYMYFFPGTYDRIAAQFDTTSETFDGGPAWSYFDLFATDAGPEGGAIDGDGVESNPMGVVFNLIGYESAVFDGRYLYLAPEPDSPGATSAPPAPLVRYDTTAPFGSGAAWTTFDTRTVNPDAHSFLGAAFDGRYVYLAPTGYTISSNVATNSFAARYDTTASFDSGAAWETFDTTTRDPYAAGFAGCVFDGRYIYFVPSTLPNSDYPAAVTRFDTHESFTDSSAWSVFDMSVFAANQGNWSFHGGAFDGRYVYLVPTASAPIVRYDTTGGFGDTTSWSSFLVQDTGLSVTTGFNGAVFDGQFLYLIPSASGPVVIFDARTPPQLPPAPPSLPAGYPGSGSFF